MVNAMSSQALIDKIMKTAENEAEQITNDILRRAGENEKLIFDRVNAEKDAILKESQARCEQIKKIAHLTSGLAARKARLHTRRELLDLAFGQAYSDMLALPDDKRRSYIERLAAKYAPADKITARVSKKDLPLFDNGVLTVNTADGRTVIAALSEDEHIKGGIYMSSPEADTDCTLDSVFAELREKYEAEADRIMFSADGNGNV